MEIIHHNPTIKAYLYSFGTHANNAFKTKNCNKVLLGSQNKKDFCKDLIWTIKNFKKCCQQIVDHQSQVLKTGECSHT
jgi:hypothetical protein